MRKCARSRTGRSVCCLRSPDRGKVRQNSNTNTVVPTTERNIYVDKLQQFICKYKNKKYPNHIKPTKLIEIFERVGHNYLSESLCKDFIKTQKIRDSKEGITSNQILDSLQRIIDIQNNR